MKTLSFLSRIALCLALSAALAQASTITGTITNKTTGKPSAGDTVSLVDVQGHMNDVANTKSDAKGRYTLKTPGDGPYLVRATHQGAGYYISAPQSGTGGDIGVYDVAAKVKDISLEADVIEVEAQNGTLSINERFFIHNTSKPPVAQWSPKSFEIVLPAEATVIGAQGQRPAGLPTTIKLEPGSQKGHYFYNFPIQPDNGDKETLLQVGYTLPYSGGKYTIKSVLPMAAQNFAVLVPKAMTFTAGAGADFKSVQTDPGVQTFLIRGVAAGQTIEYTVTGTGTIPRDDQSGQNGQASGQPGGGIGTPIASPDPLSKYKWWILGVFVLLLAGAAAFLLGKPAGTAAGTAQTGTPQPPSQISALKDELFALESDRISGKISPEEYAQTKAALEVVLKRALGRNETQN